MPVGPSEASNQPQRWQLENCAGGRGRCRAKLEDLLPLGIQLQPPPQPSGGFFEGHAGTQEGGHASHTS